MGIFYLTLRQMLMMLVLMATGFLLRKKSWLPDNAHITMSRLETFVFVPALTLFNQMTQCTAESLMKNTSLILYGLVLTLIAMALSYPLSRLFIKDSSQSSAVAYQRNVYKYALTFGNYGFMGYFIVLGVWGDSFFYQYLLFTLFVGIVGNSWGLYILIPKDKNANIWKNLKKGLLTPPTITLFLGMLIGLLNLKQYMPDFLLAALSDAGDCLGPVAMVLAGFVIGGYNFKELLRDKKVYVATAFRLILIPAAMMLLLKLIGMSDEIMTLALITFATPLGLNTIVFPAAYGGDTKTGAAMAMISHTLSVITIPVMYLVFIELL